MVELFCTPFIDLIDRMRLEFSRQQSFFDLPRRKWYLPPAPDAGADLSVRFHDRLVGNPVGPASGPQSQMAQNLVLAWLAGSRIMELKTVQIDDQLRIARPCIDATNVGYNIEWSQELLVDESLDQYVQGAMLIHMLRFSPESFGSPFDAADVQGIAGDTIYDMSIGYDLAGIRSAKVTNFIRGMMDASSSVARLRDQLPGRLGKLRDLDFPTELSRSITLSTFHGCPAAEIERICEFLLTQLGVHVVVKMNPPMLGQERLEYLLNKVMGYTDISVNPGAYTSGLQFDQSLEICGRLSRLAASKGLNFGAKFSNTLEVINHLEFFPPEENVMYLSGAPLHVITLTLAHEFRKAMGPELPISFSAGVDRKNFANLVSCGFVPITTCTDLLKTGGYGRLPPYLNELQKAMGQVGAATIDDYILDCRGQREASGGSAVQAGLLNTARVVEETQADDRYWAAKNRSVPKRIDSHLVTFDCITCDKCIPVCPNDANFSYDPGQVDITYRDLEVGTDGSITPIGEEKAFHVEQKSQIANFADYCNHCGNCDTFCPEYDGPYIKKPSFFGSQRAFEEGAPHDGFLVQHDEGRLALLGRISGRMCRLEATPDGGYGYWDGTITVRVGEGGDLDLDSATSPPAAAHCIDMGCFHTLVTLLRGVTSSARIHAVNAPLIAGEQL